MKIHS